MTMACRWRYVHHRPIQARKSDAATATRINCFCHTMLHTTRRWHCVFHDRYERINFWSHAVPGVALLLLGALAAAGKCRMVAGRKGLTWAGLLSCETAHPGCRPCACWRATSRLRLV